MTRRRVKPLPPRWNTTRLRILHRDNGVCHVCGQPGATVVDHIIAASKGGTDDDENLAPIHATPCHATKTAREAQSRRAPQARRRREPEPHPGVVTESD